jgi:hypothetical protein
VAKAVQARIGELAYQGAADAELLLGQEEDLLNEEAQTLANMLRDSECDADAQKHFGIYYD